MELTITKDNFESEVMKSDIPVLLDFWAAWCGPCRMLAPAVAEIAKKYDGKVKVGKVNVDEEYELATSFQVASIPTVVVINNGEVVNRSIGAVPMEQLEALLNFV